MKRIALIIFIIVISLFTLTACTDKNTKSELEIKLEGYEFELNGKEVSENFLLPNELFGKVATWTSDNEAIEVTETESGFLAVVTMLEKDESQVTVKLTVNVEDLSKDFTVKVNPYPDFAKFEFEHALKVVEEDFVLPNTVLGYPATWTSDNEAIEVIESDGIITAKVNRPELAMENVSVFLTLHVLKENANYRVYVKPLKIGDPNINHTIIFYSSYDGAAANLINNAIKAFETKYFGWTIRNVQVGGYSDLDNQILVDLENGRQPDIALCYMDYVANYLSSGKVIDLNPFISLTEGNIGYSQNELADFVESFYNEGLATNFGDYDKYGYTSNSLLTLPFVKSTEVMYYNKTVLDSLGLAPAKTWDELWGQCALMKMRYSDVVPFGYDSESNFFITMCKQNGWGYTSANASHYLFNNPETISWLNKIHGYYENGYLTTQRDYGMYLSNLFCNGELIYYIGSSNGASHNDPRNDFEWGIAPIPSSNTANGVNSVSIAQGPSLVMFEGGYNATNTVEKALMTFLFMKELLDPTFQAAFAATTNYNPCRISSYDVKEYAEYIKGNSIQAVAQRVSKNMIDRMFTTPSFVGTLVAREEVGNAFLDAMQGRKTAEAALSDAQFACETNENSAESESLLIKENMYGLYSFRSNKRSN